MNWLKRILLRWLIPDKQYYVQMGGFHSHFHSIFHTLTEGEQYFDDSDKGDNGGESIH